MTDVPKVYVIFNAPQQESLYHLIITDAKKYLVEGYFGENTMASKIKAAVNFVGQSGTEVLITTATLITEVNRVSYITII